jgi:hypothetical protein
VNVVGMLIPVAHKLSFVFDLHFVRRRNAISFHCLIPLQAPVLPVTMQRRLCPHGYVPGVVAGRRPPGLRASCEGRAISDQLSFDGSQFLRLLPRTPLSLDDYQVARISPEHIGIMDDEFSSKPMQRRAACAGSILAGNDPVGS